MSCARGCCSRCCTNDYIAEETEVFQSYLEGSADERLTEGYLSHFASGYVIQEREPEPFIWKELKRRSRNGDASDVMCELALLGHFASAAQLDEEEARMVRRFLNDLVMKRGIVLGSFMRFAELYPGMRFYEGRAFVEYKTEGDETLMLHYMRKGSEKSVSYLTQELESCYPGIYSRSFLLSFGESVEYYITERRGEQETLVQSGSLCWEDGKQEQGRIAGMNRFLSAALGSDPDGGKAEQMLETYLRADFSAEQFFTLR